MKNFNFGPLKAWKRVATGEMLDFPVPGNGYRKVTFDVMADSHITVTAVAGDEAWIVGLGDGILAVSFTTDQNVAIVFQGDPDAECFIKTHVDTQVIPESVDASFTTIEPRPAGPSEEVRRMMAIQRINNERRERMLLEEIQRLNSRQPVLVEPERPRQPIEAAQPGEPAQEGGTNAG